MSIKMFSELPECIAELVLNKKTFYINFEKYLVNRSFYSLEFIND